MTVFKITMATAMLAALAACGGGSTGEGGGGGGGGGGASFNDLADSFNDLAEGSGFLEGEAENNIALFDELPTSGDASFDGVIAVVAGTESDFADADVDAAIEVSDVDALGEIGLDVDFGNMSVTGSATNFVNADDEAITGTIAFDDGEVVNLLTVATIGAEASGTLTDSNGDTFEITGGGLAGFFTSDQDTIVGGLGLNVNSTVDGVDYVAGNFVAGRE